MKENLRPPMPSALQPGVPVATRANVDLQSAYASGKHLVSRSIWDRSPFSLTESLLKSGLNYPLTATRLHGPIMAESLALRQ